MIRWWVSNKNNRALVPFTFFLSLLMMPRQSMKLSIEKHKSLSNEIKSDVHTCQVHRDVGWWWSSCLEQNDLTWLPQWKCRHTYVTLFKMHTMHTFSCSFHIIADTREGTRAELKLNKVVLFTFHCSRTKNSCVFCSFHFTPLPSSGKALWTHLKKTKYYATW